MLLSRFVARILLVALMVLGAGVACGQDYPNKIIRIAVNTPGGGSDFVARQIAQGIAGPLGQSVIVEYHGSGVLTIDFASKAPPDGYTLTVQGAVLWLTPLVQKMPYDAVRDFSPISLITREVNILAVHPSVPAKSVKELIALAKARPGELNYSTGSVGSALHLAGELFKHMAGVNIAIVNYKGPAPAITALIGGEVHLAIFDAGLLAPHVKSGRLRALAVTSAEPTALVPGLPTIAASGLPGYEMVGMTGIFAPAKTPAPIINRLNQEIVRYLRTADAKEKFFSAGADTVGNTPEQFAAIIKSDTAIMGKLVKDLGLRTD